jgi:hypothetical protein
MLVFKSQYLNEAGPKSEEAKIFLMEIFGTNPPYRLPAFIQCLHHILRERTLFEVHQIFFQLSCATSSNDNRVTKLSLEQ